MHRKSQKALQVSLATLLFAVLTAGCSWRTLSTETNLSDSGVVHGMPYFLPIGKITLKGEFKTPAPDNTSDTNTTTTQTTAHTTEVQGAVGAESPPPAKTATPPPAKAPNPPATGNPSSNSGGGSVAVAAGGWTITMTADVEADSAFPRYAIPKRNYVFDDEYHVTVNSKHLLSVGKTTAEDRSADIVGAVASLMVQSGRFLVAQDTTHESFYFSFDPSDDGQFTTVQNQLLKRLIYIDIDPRPSKAGKNVVSDNAPGEQGLAFRLAASYRISLKYPCKTTCDAGRVISYSHQFLLPDKRTYVFDYARMLFVKKVTEIGFTDGMLTDYHETLPSPVLGFLGIPKAILTAIVPLPSSASSGGSGSKTGAGAGK